MAEGQFSGSRAAYIYIGDTGVNYVLTLDSTLGNLEALDLILANPTNAGNASPLPKRFKPRHVWWQGVLSGRIVRKKLICGTLSAIAFDSLISQSITIDGVAGVTTGRVGESMSFVRFTASG